MKRVRLKWKRNKRVMNNYNINLLVSTLHRPFSETVYRGLENIIQNAQNVKKKTGNMFSSVSMHYDHD